MDCNYVQEAAEYVRARIGETPRIGLILGSGLGYLGDQVENGLFPDDRATLGRIVQDISYNNADRYFKFPRK